MDVKLAKKRYIQQKVQAKGRGLEFTLTFEEWKQIWLDSGKWEQRGRGKGQYVMSRFGDQGGYTLGNVFIQSAVQNIKDATPKKIGRVHTLETKLRMSRMRKGKVPSEYTQMAM